MNRRFVLRAMMWTALALLLVLLPPDAVAQNCACRDVNNDGVCDSADLPVLDSQWLGGVAFSDRPSRFSFPAGCSYTLDTAPVGGVRVTAKRIVFGGSLTITPVGGSGVLFDAVQDIVFLPGSQITAGGVVAIPTNVPANTAIARASIGLRAGTTCTLLATNLVGNPVTGFGAVGIQCGSDIQIHGSEIVAAGINIQSLVLIAKGDVDLGMPGPGNVLEGRYKISIIAETATWTSPTPRWRTRCPAPSRPAARRSSSRPIRSALSGSRCSGTP